MNYHIIPVTPFQQNCTLLWEEDGQQAAILDPGGEAKRILAQLERLKLEPVKILLTHGHLDHVGAAGDLAHQLGIPIEGPHRDDLPWIQSLDQQSTMFGQPRVTAFTPNRWLEPGERVTLGAEELEVLHCPGHTPGHLVFFHRASRLLLVGDVLFQGSIGRTDFPLGNHEALLQSIHEQLWPLGDDVRFIPGHGPMSTLGAERRTNPFVGDRASRGWG